MRLRQLLQRLWALEVYPKENKNSFVYLFGYLGGVLLNNHERKIPYNLHFTVSLEQRRKQKLEGHASW